MSIPVFLASDDNYAPFVASTIASICSHTKSFCDFYILDGGISEENKEKICKLKEQFDNFFIEFLFVDLEKEFKNIVYKNAGSYISLSTYNRFLIPQLKPHLQKVIYMDVDVVVLDDIQKLYNEDISAFALGAIWDKSRKYYNTDTKDLINLSENYKYFNAGVLLIDVQKWKNDNVLKAIFELEQKYREKILHADETLLNKYFDENYQVLGIKYNYTDYDVLTHPMQNIVIRHFATAVKPWHIHPDINTSMCPNTQDFWKYAKMTSFYNQLLENCSNKTKQQEMLRKLRIQNMITKSYFPKI